MGEMDYWYASADVVYLGGSLVNTGGHNPLEASLYGVPVVSGPNIFNFDDVYEILCKANIAWVEKDITSVTTRLKALLSLTETETTTLRMLAQETLIENKGATAKLIRLSDALIKTTT